MEKINIAELLKDCPKGMELDCTMFEDVYFDCIDDVSDIIKCYIQDTKQKIGISFNKYGQYSNISKTKCAIFPKGKTSWEGFHRPFKDGDIVATENGLFIGIIKVTNNIQVNTYCVINISGSLSVNTKYYFDRLATEEEKQKLFKAIKDNGYKWNEETKTLEKLDEPKFKVGDKVLWNYDTEIPRVISKVEPTSTRGYVYWIDCDGCSSGWWSEDELTPIPDKFDITTLKPFDKVLVRDNDKQTWCISFFSHCNGLETYKYSCINGSGYSQCIPYEGNEHLIGVINDCSDFYKTWEK